KPVGPLPLTLKRRDGAQVQLEIRTYPLVVGNQTLVLGIGRDVTERNNAEARLRDQAKLLDAAHEAIIVKKLDGTITYWNKGAERLYGWKSHEIVGRSCFETLYKDPAEVQRMLPHLLADGVWEGETEKQTKEGQVLNVQVSLTLVR